MTRRVLACIVALGALLAPGATRADVSRFRPVDVWLDSGGQPLAAYQVEITAGPDAAIVGVEGGAGAFAEPPHYDPAALRGGRIILAAFTTTAGAPQRRTRVATLHMRESGDAQPSYRAVVMVAAAPDGRRIPASVELVPRQGDPR